MRIQSRKHIETKASKLFLEITLEVIALLLVKLAVFRKN